MSYDFESNETHDVKIEDVKPLEKRLNVVFKVNNREEEREINSRSGETHRVCDLSVADETGSIILTLWNEDIDAVEDGKVYKLSNGFANIFNNSLRLSKGKYGEIAEDSTVFDEVNEDNNRSAEHVEDPRRRDRGGYGGRRDRGSYGGGGGRDRGSYGGGRDRGRQQNRSSGRRQRW